MSSLCQLVYFLQDISRNLQSDELLRNIPDKATKEGRDFLKQMAMYYKPLRTSDASERMI